MTYLKANKIQRKRIQCVNGILHDTNGGNSTPKVINLIASIIEVTMKTGRIKR